MSILARKGSNELEILYDNYASSLYGVIQRLVQNEEVSEEILKNTFIKIWNNFSLYNPAKDRLSSWMINIARNMAQEKVDSMESKSKDQYESIEKIISRAEPLKTGNLSRGMTGFNDLISKMDAEYSQILYLLFFSGFSQSEVALKLNIPLGTVRNRTRSAILKLRNYLDKLSA